MLAHIFMIYPLFKHSNVYFTYVLIVILHYIRGFYLYIEK